ncbi:DnaD domain protein [Enterococcus cecorum]|uniref:DnaD domain-containing protein n=1 Tax=Enterococcus cecorum TaxID=44008 RepID=UPI001FAC76FC|nr:DnaD domain protein [Enterococcus cecorum]MCJ0543357.1 DnaD domain protein [Enterococcus cecorum]MCJ0548081.1 DnaD domain protein [Enterococcus cecorum]
MAERRMINKRIIVSDTFLDMPLSAQALYFHLNAIADDDGFIENPNSFKRMIGASNDDLKILIAKQYILPFESGVVVVKHWLIHNYIRRDRYNETMHVEEKKKLQINEDKTYSYYEGIPLVNQPTTNGIPMVDTGKDRTGKDRTGKDNNHNTKQDENILEGSPQDEQATSSLSSLFEFWESNGFGMLAPKTRQDLAYWVKDFQEIGASEQEALELIQEALNLAINANARRYNYVNGILKNWEAKRYTNVKQVNADRKASAGMRKDMTDRQREDAEKVEREAMENPNSIYNAF